MFLPLFLLSSILLTHSFTRKEKPNEYRNTERIFFALIAFSNFHDVKIISAAMKFFSCFIQERMYKTFRFSRLLHLFHIFFLFLRAETASWHFKCSKHVHKSIPYWRCKGPRKNGKLKEKRGWRGDEGIREVHAIKNNKFWSIENICAEWNGKHEWVLKDTTFKIKNRVNFLNF